MEPARIGVVGCGAVSHMYLPILARVPDVEVVAVADVDTERAHAAVEQHGVGTVLSSEDLLASPEVEIVCNLTPIPVHVAVSTAALAAGKHVYSEKPLAVSLSDATALVAQARAGGRALACAPDTLLGSGFQVAREALAGGAIGRPLSANGFMFRSGLTRPSAYSEGATPFFDMAPYYVSALVNLFGPVARVGGATRMRDDEPKDRAGAPIAVAGLLEFASGLAAELVLAWGTSHRREVPVLTVYGTDGELRVPNPNNFGDPGFVQTYHDSDWTELPGSRQPDDWPRNLRGLGVAEMARAIREDRPPRANGDIACHVVDVIAALVRSAQSGRRVETTTSCEPSPTLPAAERAELVG